MIFSRAPLLVVLGLFLGLLTISVHGTIINTSIKRVFDLTKHVVRMHTDIQFMDKESDTNEYSFQLSKDMSERLSHMTAKCGGGKGVCEVLQAGTTYTVVLKTSVEKGTTGQIKLIAYFTGVLTPYPEEITQKEDQLVVFEAHHVFFSPYVTETQTTKLKLPSGRVESFSDMKPVVHKGASITYGPYTKVQPFNALPTNKSLRVHFKNHSPFLTVTTLVKEIEVSMWGRVSVEEVYDLLHTGAKLKGGFSRFDYAHGAYGASLYELTAHLPRDAVNVYYRDQIGNVSTSRLRHTDTRQELEFKPRFPIFGGWKTQWYFGYSVPTHSALSRHGKTFKLEMDFSTPIEEAAVEELTVKVILPEGATNIQVDVPFDIDAQSRTSRQTYLDTPLYGRPVLVIKKTNVIAQHNVPFQVSFEFTSTFMLHEPLVLVGGYFVFFVVCMILFRLDLSLVTTKKQHTKKKTE